MTWALALALAAVAVALRLWVALESGFQVDDAWITYRYAENLAAGEGFVYNPGERVYGTTTPLLTLLLAGADLAGVPLPAASLALALAATAAALGWLALLAAPRIGAAWAALVLGLLAVAPSHVVWSVSGMETALFVAFLAGAFLAYERGRWTLLGLAAAGAFLTRIDAVVLLAAVAATELLLALLPAAASSDRPAPARGRRRAALVFLAAVAPWLAFALLYFGSAVPQAVWAKTGIYRGLSWERVPDLLHGALDPRLAPWPLELALTLAGAAALLRRPGRLAAVPVWLAGNAAFLALGQVHLHPWYLAPFHPFVLLLWGFALAWLARLAAGLAVRFHRGLLARRRPPAATRLSLPARVAAALGATAVIAAAAVPAARIEARSRQESYETAHAAIGRYLAERTRPGEVVYAWDIGYVGYLSGREILDFQGIVSPSVVPYNRRRDYAGVLLDFRPDWAVVGLYSAAAGELLGSPAVRRRYREVYRNAAAGPEHVLGSAGRRAYGAEYVVLRRR